jgi:predicted phosphodiesterase
VAGQLTRILSDVHYGDRASRVRGLHELQPLVAGTDAVVFNGDTMDTRAGPNPQHTAACRAEIAAFAKSADAPLTLLTGNHDPDISSTHWTEFAGGEVFVVHGDVLFDEIVPWGKDARLIRRLITERTGRPTAGLGAMPLPERMAIWRHIAGSIPQRHQSERHPAKYALHFALDTVWPPTRFLEIFRAWHREPGLAAELVRRHQPKAKYVLLGHTHRPAIRRIPGGPIIINTGSFTAPFGGYAVDVTPGQLIVRRTRYHGGAFRPGAAVAEFPLRGA